MPLTTNRFEARSLDWPAWRQYLLAAVLAIAGLGLGVLLVARGGGPPALMGIGALMVLVPLLRPGAVAASAAIGALGLTALQEAAPGGTGMLLYLGGAALAVGTAAWSARAHDRASLAWQRSQATCESLRDILASLNEGVIAADRDHRVSYMNPSASSLTGWPVADAVGRPLAEVYQPIDDQRREPLPQPAQRAGRGAWPGPVRLLTPDGREPVVEDSVAVLSGADADGTGIDGSGAAHGLVVVLRDAAERHAAEHARLRQLERLLEADRRKDDFLATLAHELRNPLAPAAHALALLKLTHVEPALERQAREQAVGILDRQLRHMVRLVEDLMEVSRITRDRLELRRSPVELATVLAQAAEAVRPALSAAGQKLTLSQPDEPVWLEADASRLVQVFSNLLGNAGKYSAPGAPVTVQVTVQAPGPVPDAARTDGRWVEVAVRDRGIGIEPVLLPRLFEMFSQVQRSTQPASGLGIGLGLARRLAELHGGEIVARSAGLGLGSEFVVRLPLGSEIRPAASASPADEPGPAAAAGPWNPLPLDTMPPPPPEGGRWRVLVVDDNRDAADTLAMLLTLCGYDTRTAHDGLRALDAAQLFRPQLVLLDIGLPQLDGHEVARRLRQQAWARQLVLVALTGWGQAPDRLASDAAGFDAHLVKPVDHGALLPLLARLLLTRRGPDGSPAAPR